MEYEYTLKKTDAKKYGFTHLITNGWFGYYADQFNKKFNDYKKCYIDIKLTNTDIDRIVKNSTNYIEY